MRPEEVGEAAMTPSAKTVLEFRAGATYNAGKQNWEGRSLSCH